MNKKITTAALTAAAMLLSCTGQQMPLTAFADSAIAINEANFPDANFRAIVTADTIDTDKDDMLSADEIAAVTALNVSDQGITDLTGSENFTALTELNCRNNALTTLDVCFFPDLLILNCDNNALTEIDLLVNTALELFSCEGNAITALDLSKNTALTDIDCSGNQLTSLNLRYNTALSTLDYSGNAYPLCGLSLDEITENGFEPERVKAWSGAEYDADTNSLTDVTSSTVTYTYDAGNDRIASFSLVLKPSGLFALGLDTSVYLSWDEFDGAAMYSVSYNDGEGDVLYADDLTDDHCVVDGLTNGTEYTFEVRACVDGVWTEASYVTEAPDVIVTIDEDTFPDDTFREVVQSFDDDGDGILDVREIEAVTTLTLTDMELTDLKGIECFYSLVELNCDGCGLIELDVRENTALEALDCSDNELTKLDVSKNTALRTLNCSYNELTKLDVSKNNALTSLDCSNNKLVEIGLDGARLVTFDCSDNQLTSFDIIGDDLQTFDTDGNSYTLRSPSLDELKKYGFEPEKASEWSGAEYDAKTNSLTNITSSEIYYTYIVSGFLHTVRFSLNFDIVDLRASGYCNTVYIAWNKVDGADKYAVTYTDGASERTIDDITDTYCTIDELENDTEYSFEVKAYVNGSWTSSETVTAVPVELVDIDQTNFPDDIFRGIVTSDAIDTNNDDKLSEAEIKAVSELDVSEREIADLSGIEYFTALTSLDCGSNDLTKLDVRNNAALTYLSCLNNQLAELDIGKKTMLEILHCEWNSITDLDISNCAELAELYAGGNALTELDVSNCMELVKLYCGVNDLTELDVSRCSKLEELDCEDNFLTALDVSGNTALTTLFCDNDRLTHLDISSTAVTSENFTCSYNFYELDDLSLDALTERGFDGSRASDWNGAAYDTETNSLTDVTSEIITYTYDAGRELKVTFTLVYDATKPHNVKAAAGDGKVTITWDEVEGAARYAVYMELDGNNTCLDDNITDTSYTATDLTNGTEYGFFVKAYADKWSEASATVYATPKEADIVPKNVRAGAGDSKVQVKWDAVEGAESYRVMVWDGTKWTGYNTTSTSYMVRNLTNGKKYAFAVKTYANGAYSDTSAIVYATPVAASIIPTGVKAGAGDAKVQVKWDAVEGAESYRVMVWDGTKWTGYNTTSTSYMVRNLTNGKKYAFAVKTYANGAYSDTSAIVYATPVASIIPTGVKVGAGDAKVQVKWNAVTGASSYRVMVWDGAKWTGYSTTSTSYMVRNLTNNKKYAFAVKAYVNGAYGDVSTILYAVPHNATSIIPADVKAGAGDAKVQVKWNTVYGATSYRVMVWDGTKWTGYSTTSTSYMVRNLTNGKKYAFAVKAYINGAYSDVSTTVYATPVANIVS